MTKQKLIDYVKGLVGKSVDYDNYYGAQCVDLIMHVMKKFWGESSAGNAIDYKYNRLPKGFTRWQGNRNIKAGDILVWDFGDRYGHIGVCISKFGNYATSVEQNVDGTPEIGGPARIRKRHIGRVTAVIRPPYNDVKSVTTYSKYNRIAERWHFNVTAGKLNVRNTPSVKDNKPVAQYERGDRIKYDSYCINEGYVWISYISWTGKRRYVATGRWVNGRNDCSFGNFR